MDNIPIEEARQYIGWRVKTNSFYAKNYNAQDSYHEGVVLDVYPCNDNITWGFVIQFDTGLPVKFWSAYIDVIEPPPSKDPLPLPG